MSDNFANAKTTSFDAIPVIDLSDIGTEDGFAKIAEELVHTAKTVGFFYIKGHGISSELMAQAFGASKRFFELPVEQKSSISVDTNQRGWMGEGMTKLEGSKTHDSKEVFFWGYEVEKDDPDVLAGVPMVFPNQWPDEVAPFLKRDLAPYYQGVIDLSKTVLSALAVGLGKNRDFFDAAYEKPLARAQLVYYPPMGKDDEAEQRFGAASHTDFGVLTVLMQDMQGGLQVLNQDDEWIEAPPIEGAFVCNIGDLLERWTNGELVSTKHRVINRNKTARYSIPVFCDPSSQTIIDPNDFSNEKSNYELISAGEHIAGRNSKNFTQYKK
ncbi:MAG: isopenicillin N synthase family dioxygenase [Nitratireductor sp.]